MFPRTTARLALILLATLPFGCGTGGSALNPAGEAAEKIAVLFWWMTGGALLIWLGMMALAIYATRASKDIDREQQAKKLILAGAIVPTVVLAALLTYGLRALPGIVAPAPVGTLRILVTGEQWWWRMRYLPADGQPFDVANELRLPVAEPVEFLLESDNVIHSFWIPALGGKMDLIPGRTNRLVLRPTRTGTFKGFCAEFCGTAHAKMSFEAIVLPREEFDQWLAVQQQPVRSESQQ